MKYYAPFVEVELFETVDVIATSTGQSSYDPELPPSGEPDWF